jgi:hypothetical protein
MTDEHSFRGLLHRATHRVPGVPAHTDRPAGHQGTAIHGHPRHRGADAKPAPNRAHGHARRGGATAPHHGRNHSPARPPRFLPAWQRRIAAFFGQDL